MFSFRFHRGARYVAFALFCLFPVFSYAETSVLQYGVPGSAHPELSRKFVTLENAEQGIAVEFADRIGEDFGRGEFQVEEFWHTIHLKEAKPTFVREVVVSHLQEDHRGILEFQPVLRIEYDQRNRIIRFAFLQALEDWYRPPAHLFSPETAGTLFRNLYYNLEGNKAEINKYYLMSDWIPSGSTLNLPGLLQTRITRPLTGPDIPGVPKDKNFDRFQISIGASRRISNGKVILRETRAKFYRVGVVQGHEYVQTIFHSLPLQFVSESQIWPVALPCLRRIELLNRERGDAIDNQIRPVSLPDSNKPPESRSKFRHPLRRVFEMLFGR